MYDTSLDEDIITETFQHDVAYTEEEYNEEEVSDDVKKPSFNEAMDSIIVLENYSLISKFGTDLKKALKDINRAIDINSSIIGEVNRTVFFFRKAYFKPKNT